MTLKVSTMLAAAALLGASGAAMADSGGPGGKGDATTGTLGVQQRQDADAAREATGEVSAFNTRDVSRSGEAMPVESYDHNRQAAIGYERERVRPAGERVEYEVVR